MKTISSLPFPVQAVMHSLRQQRRDELSNGKRNSCVSSSPDRQLWLTNVACPVLLPNRGRPEKATPFWQWSLQEQTGSFREVQMNAPTAVWRAQSRPQSPPIILTASTPIASQMSINSITSIRRSAFSYLETNDCGLPRRCASSPG